MAPPPPPPPEITRIPAGSSLAQRSLKPAAEDTTMTGSNTKQIGVGPRLVARARAAVADSAWAGLAGRAAAYLAGFALLALVGSGRLSAWLSPPGRMAVGIAVAE